MMDFIFLRGTRGREGLRFGLMTVRGSHRSHGSTVDTREKDFVVPQD